MAKSRSEGGGGSAKKSIATSGTYSDVAKTRPKPKAPPKATAKVVKVGTPKRVGNHLEQEVRMKSTAKAPSYKRR